MPHVPHGLREEFPNDADLIHRLKADHAFAKTATRYDEINHHIHRIETELEPTSDEVLEDLKKERLHLKDIIAAALAQAKAAAR